METQHAKLEFLTAVF